MDIFTPLRVLRGNIGGILNLIFLIDKGRKQGDKRLFVDVTETRRLSQQQTGVPRVTLSVLSQLKAMPLPYSIVEVYARPHHEGFYTVDGGRPMKVAKGDVFFGLDLSKFLTQKNTHILDKIHALGVPVYFYVHDLIPITHPENCTKSVVRAFPRWLQAVSRYSGLIANSRSTRDEFASYLSSRRSRAYNERILIDYVYPGSAFNSLSFKGRTRAGHEGAVSFIAVGAMEKRKGYDQLLAAFSLLWDKGLEISLTIVGPSYGRGGAVEQSIRSSPFYGKKLFWYDSYIEDKELARLYEGSDAYISASYAEGFGLPVTEAAGYGLPLLLRDIPVFREVGGGGAFYFSSGTAEGLALSIEGWMSLYREGKAPLPCISHRSWRDCAEDLCRIMLPEAKEPVPCAKPKGSCDVSIIIVNYNTCRLLYDCLESIYKRTFGVTFEVLVSDNGSVDGSAEMVRADFPAVILLENKANLGFGAANNRALDRASGKYVFYLNSDTVLLNNAVKIFYDYWEGHPGEFLGALGCNLKWPDGRYCRSAGASRNGRFDSAAAFVKNQRELCFRSYKIAMRHYLFRKPLRLVEDMDPPVEKTVGPVGYVTGADLFLLNDERARFDEGFFMYYEEVDLEYALSGAGKLPCLIDGPEIVHLEGASSDRGKYEISDQADFSKLQMYLSAHRFFRKHSLISPVASFFARIYTALLWLNPIIVKDTGRYVRKLFKE
ncbi:MAG: glycosyltransferase [Treponema sp.]|nr:glycosyltransferase [Treponema sp.]